MTPGFRFVEALKDLRDSQGSFVAVVRATRLLDRLGDLCPLESRPEDIQAALNHARTRLVNAILHR